MSKHKTNIKDLIKNSKLTLIGYSSISEDIKDELISNLPNFYVVKGNDSSFNLKLILRDIKIDNLINKRPSIEGIVIDYYDIEKHRDESNPLNSKYAFYNRIVRYLSDLEIKVIITSPTDIVNNHEVYKITSAGVHNADLAFIIKNNKLKIEKSRFYNLEEIEIYENNYNK